VLFSGGGLFALLEGEEKLRSPHELTSVWWAIGVLLVAMCFEGWSLRTAVRESRTAKHSDESWFDFVRRSKTPELAVVLLEDSGALIGLLFALFGIVAADVTGNARFDAVGSLGIGILLVSIALTLAVEMKSLLIGESAGREKIEAICRVLHDEVGAGAVVDLRTEQLAPEELLVVGTVLVDTDDAFALEATLARAEEAIRHAVPEARLVYLEPATVAGLPRGERIGGRAREGGPRG
jgi:divalent metal cation (Fe/Co/Zn/Cd) transporter